MNKFCQVIVGQRGDTLICSRPVVTERDGKGVCKYHKHSDKWPLKVPPPQVNVLFIAKMHERPLRSLSAA